MKIMNLCFQVIFVFQLLFSSMLFSLFEQAQLGICPLLLEIVFIINYFLKYKNTFTNIGYINMSMDKVKVTAIILVTLIKVEKGSSNFQDLKNKMDQEIDANTASMIVATTTQILMFLSLLSFLKVSYGVQDLILCIKSLANITCR